MELTPVQGSVPAGERLVEQPLLAAEAINHHSSSQVGSMETGKLTD